MEWSHPAGSLHNRYRFPSDSLTANILTATPENYDKGVENN